MGGDYYDRGPEPEPKPASTATYSETAAQILSRNHDLHPALDPKNRQIVCTAANPVIIALDVTGSMGDWGKVMWDKLPMFFGQIMMQGYLGDPAICFAGVSDSYDSPAPLQVTDFAAGSEIDNMISKMCPFFSGGGNNRESYDMMAYYALNCMQFPNLPAGEKPFLFFTGDEGIFAETKAEHLERFLGVHVPADIPAASLWRALRERFHVFLLHKNYNARPGPFDERVLQEWTRCVGPEHILHLDDSKACVDMMLGAIALTAGARSLDRYTEDLRDRGQSDRRQAEVRAALRALATESPVPLPPPPEEPPTPTQGC